jgi:hypothetical protein
MPLVEARGVAGAVSGNSVGSVFIGTGNRDARCLRRPKLKRPEPLEVLGVRWGLGGFSKETCPPELASEREDSEARAIRQASGGAGSATTVPNRPQNWSGSS